METLTIHDLKLVLGCYCKYKDGQDWRLGRLTSAQVPSVGYLEEVQITLANDTVWRGTDYENIKPVLRPFSDLSDKEALIIAREQNENATQAGYRECLGNPGVEYKLSDQEEWKFTSWMNVSINNIDEFEFFLYQNFDMWQWIERGLALDATQLERNPYENRKANQ